MKKIKAIGYIILIVIVVVLSLTIYTNASKDTSTNQKDKIFAEIKLIETKISNLLNTMNNIEARNYSVVTSELSKATTEKSESDNGSLKGGSEGEEDSNSKKGSSGDMNDSTTSEEGDSQKNKKFDLKSKGILTNTDDINWDNIKTEIENLYTSLPTITIDLYQGNVDQGDVLAFNTEYDKLTNVVKDEKKEETLAQLTKVYEFIPKFLRSSGQEEIYTTVAETKYNVFKGYSKLDSKNFEEISGDIKSAIDSYSKLLTSTNIDARKQYNISKCYIMLNELQNAVNLQDEAVFLIKYKNLLEEFNNV